MGETTAQDVLHQYWGMDIEERISWDLTLDLIREDGSWKIDKIERGSSFSPQGVVQLFYNWYFSYGEYDRSLGSMCYALAPAENPLADRAYRHSPYLARDFIAQVDVLLDEEEAAAPTAAFDPFLCARNHPWGFFVLMQRMQVGGALRTVDGDGAAIVTAYAPIPGTRRALGPVSQ